MASEFSKIFPMQDNINFYREKQQTYTRQFVFSNIKAMDLLWFPLLIIGSILLGLANSTPAPLFVAVFFTCLGLIICIMVFRNKIYELRAFLLTYSISVLVAGFAQYYALSTFAMLQTTPDAMNTFFPSIAQAPPFTSMQDVPINFNSPLALLIWQSFYALAWLLGLKFGPYTGVLCNAFVVGLTGATTVTIARELFGNDHWRLRRLSTLVAFCGLFWLFGAIFIRDGFVLFINTLMLWRLVAWLNRPSIKNFIVSIVFTGIAGYAMLYLRYKSVVLFGLFFILAVIFLYLHVQSKSKRVFIFILTSIIIVFGSAYIWKFYQISMEFKEVTEVSYLERAHMDSSADSLGVQLIMDQPLPIRLLIGSGAIAIYPIPIWASLKPGASEYHIIKNFNGVYQIVVMPLVLTGFLIVFQQAFAKRKSETMYPLLFVAFFSLIGLFSVVVTSMETRHFGQFLPGFLILAVLPDLREARVRRNFIRISISWYSVVILVHIAWAVAKL